MLICIGTYTQTFYTFMSRRLPCYQAINTKNMVSKQGENKEELLVLTHHAACQTPTDANTYEIHGARHVANKEDLLISAKDD